MKINFEDIKIKQVKISEPDLIESILNIDKTLELNIVSKSTLMDDFQNEHYKYFVIIFKEEIIGYFCILNLFDFVNLNAIAISKEYQNKGVGSNILNYIFNYCKLNKFNKILLEVRISNKQAINFYQKHDFENINIRKNYYSNNEDAFVFEKILN